MLVSAVTFIVWDALLTVGDEVSDIQLSWSMVLFDRVTRLNYFGGTSPKIIQWDIRIDDHDTNSQHKSWIHWLYVYVRYVGVVGIA